VTFYLNGVAAGSGTGVTNPVAATIAFAIGAVAGAVDGMVAEFRYYDVAVSAGEVANIYAGNGTPSANLRGWWRLDEGYGTSVTDWSGYANVGTLTNSPVWVCGEDEYSFTAGAQTGVVTFWGEVRRLIVARNDMDSVGIEFVRSAEVLANVPLSIQGLV
jgi:hypothetical protein